MSEYYWASQYRGLRETMNTPIESFRLIVFRVVAERLSFTQAADVLHLTQPAVTSQIKALETELGLRLLERAAGGVHLTPAGEHLYRFAIEMGERARQTWRELGALSGEQLGNLSLGASTTIAQYLLPRLLSQFLHLHPRVDITVVGANTAQIVGYLLGRRIQLGLIEGPPGRNDIKTEKFVDDEIVMIVAAGHPFASGSGAPDVDHLRHEPWLVREPGSGTRRVVEEALRKVGLGPRDIRIAMELDSTEAIKSAVEAGLGIGFVSRWALRPAESPSIRAIRIQGLEIKRELRFIYPQGPEPEGPAYEFLRLARQFRSQYSAPPPQRA
jgi:DNA-binding transcriptional LysR family regulator